MQTALNPMIPKGMTGFMLRIPISEGVENDDQDQAGDDDESNQHGGVSLLCFGFHALNGGQWNG